MKFGLISQNQTKFTMIEQRKAKSTQNFRSKALFYQKYHHYRTVTFNFYPIYRNDGVHFN